MGVEIERKYLLKNSAWRSLADNEQKIKQGYLSLDKDRTVRIRIADQKGILTIKGRTIGTTRAEFEYEIPFEDANQLLKLCVKSVIEKTRYIIKVHGNVWEIDVFEGDNQGLEIAEVELEDEEQKIRIPNWIGDEVSSEPKYYNSNLIEHPFRDWKIDK